MLPKNFLLKLDNKDLIFMCQEYWEYENKSGKVTNIHTKNNEKIEVILDNNPNNIQTIKYVLLYVYINMQAHAMDLY